MPVPNGKIETNSHKKQRRWSLIGILSKKKKLKKSQESMDFCPYDGKINQKVAKNNHLERSNDYLIQQYTCSPRQIRRCNSLQYTGKTSVYSNITSQPTSIEWKSSQQSVCSSSSSACYSDIGVYRNCGLSSNRSSYYIEEENEQASPTMENLPSRCSSEIGDYQNKTRYLQKYHQPPAVNHTRIIGKKIPPPPPPRDPNVKAVYYFRNNRLMSRESDSTYFSQGSDDNIPDQINEYDIKCKNEYYEKEPPRSRRPIQIYDVETLSTESENSEPRTQSVEEAIQELEDIYNSLGLSDEDLLDRAERRDLPTLHQNMQYESFDELDGVTFKRLLPKTRRSRVPDIVSDDMAYRRLNKKEPKRSTFVPGSFLLVLPTVYNVDKTIKRSEEKPSGEPDITLDDVVFRSRRQHLNFLKISDPQPPFGIPLGPIVGTAASDYLHAVPEGRYKPSFHPRKVPDTVEDDLAFRTLRKDNKYKTCIDFSFLHRNRLNTDYLLPRPERNSRINNDTHWMARRSAAGEQTSSNKSRVKFLFDRPVGDGRRQNLMVVKINHHKPIILSGFDLNEANQLSESFFCTKSLQHEHHRSNRLRLTNRTCSASTPNGGGASQSLTISNRASDGPEWSAEVVTRQRRAKSHRHASVGVPQLEAAVKRESASVGRDARPLVVQFTDLSADDGRSARGCGKSQPNFRELILREYRSYRYPPSTTDDRLPEADRSRGAIDVIDDRVASDDRDTTNSRATTAAGYACPAETGSRFESSCNVAATGNVPENRTETTERPVDPSSSSPSAEYPNRAPGYLEVCLYITIYIYHLFSVNAYSTYIALIFLVALHLCRRLS
uniref:Uncharacterized protein n=1 Tax=Sipha flava TaxID=143950 RepID=A0A2S2R6G0_9HEMI